MSYQGMFGESKHTFNTDPRYKHLNDGALRAMLIVATGAEADDIRADLETREHNRRVKGA